MDIDKATKSLQEHLHYAPWLTAVGVGKKNERELIILYVPSIKRAREDFSQPAWQGFPVVIRKMGIARALASGSG